LANRLAEYFDKEHHRQFHFSFGKDHELVQLRAVVESQPSAVEAVRIQKGGPDPGNARVSESRVFIDGSYSMAPVYDRAKLLAGNIVDGPAIITEMDSTTLIPSDCQATVDDIGVILIRPRAIAPSHSLAATDQGVTISSVDTVTLDIVENALRSIRCEMDAVLYRTAMSPGIREQHDQVREKEGYDVCHA